MSLASEWTAVWRSPGERLFVESQTEENYTRHRFRSNGEGPGALAIALRHERVMFIRIFRPATGKTLLELPRGQGDICDQGDPEKTARRELEEETGWTSASTRIVGHVWPDSGLCADRTTIVLCEGLSEPSEIAREEAEHKQVYWLNAQEIRNFIVSGDIEDGQTMSALLKAGIL